MSDLRQLVALAHAQLYEAEQRYKQALDMYQGLLRLQEERDDLIAVAALQAQRLQATMELEAREPEPRLPQEPELASNRGSWVVNSQGVLVPKFNV